MVGTETRRRPDFFLFGSVYGPFELILPGAIKSGASLLCSTTRCSCSRSYNSSKLFENIRNINVKNNSRPLPAKASIFSSVNRYFKADIRLAKVRRCNKKNNNNNNKPCLFASMTFRLSSVVDNYSPINNVCLRLVMPFSLCR